MGFLCGYPAAQTLGAREAAKTGFAFEAWAEENYMPTWGGCYQVKLAKPLGDFLIYGRLDCLKAGVVYDY